MDNLSDFHLTNNPWENFTHWYQEASNTESNPDKFILSTVSEKGMPRGRVLLFKGLFGESLGFVTNYQSTKAQHLDKNPHCSMVFWWENLGRQIQIEGKAEKFSSKESDDYFASRGRGSQLGAWASPQSSPISDREALLKRVKELEEEFTDKEIPRPEHWGGYKIIPESFEFFLYRDDRLNDRFHFSQSEKNWTWKRLSP